MIRRKVARCWLAWTWRHNTTRITATGRAAPGEFEAVCRNTKDRFANVYVRFVGGES